MGHTKELLNRLTEIREACEIAASPDDTNLNEVVEEIDRLALICIANLKEGKTAL
ncbi:MAG: hypothetical protein H7X86_00770 [Gorillibacterium sp.]|nr:hypothetical protein [Gorillibacterium sp.]